MFEIFATVFGIGFLLFIHEGGHFIAARMAGVRAEVFSLGFGPRIWGFYRKGTDFRLSLVPIGGYVRMAGEEQLDDPQPGELGAASAPWRFVIFSGGILMNFAFAIVVFPILFGVGVPFVAPVIGQVEPGSAAWEAGMQEGERITSIDGEELYAYLHLAANVAYTSEGQTLELGLEAPDGGTRSVNASPRYDDRMGFRRLGVSPPLDPNGIIAVLPDSPAFNAGLRDDDRLLEINGIAIDGHASLRIAAAQLLGDLAVSGVAERDGERVAFTMPAPDYEVDSDGKRIGIRLMFNHVKEARGPLSGVLEPGDEILTAGGKVVGNSLDFFAECFRFAGLPALEVSRGGNMIAVDAQPGLDPNELVHSLWLESPAADQESGLRISVDENGPAWMAGVRTGDLLLLAGDQAIEDLLEVRTAIEALDDGALNIRYRPRGSTGAIKAAITPGKPLRGFGIGLNELENTVKSDGVMGSLSMGLREAKVMALQVVQTIQGLFSGNVAAKNLGGILTIGNITHSQASRGWVPLLFFLALISINLGVLNLLPVPALDGGHLFFLLIEMVRGKPLGERAQVWFNITGFAAVLTLVVFVTWMDIQRLF